MRIARPTWTSAQLAFASCEPRELADEAEIIVATPSDEAVIVGAFERASHSPAFRRGTGGGSARVGLGTVWVQLALARADALVSANPSQILNRYVRPLLRALSRVGAPAHYFGRDWVSAGQRPVALLGFAHDTRSGRAMFEAFVAVSTSFSAPGRRSFDGKVPATLEDVAGKSIAVDRVRDAIVASYQALAGSSVEATIADVPAAPSLALTGWTATREEAIGVVAAGWDPPRRLRVGGELMVSADALALLEERASRLPPHASATDVGQIVDETLAAPGVVLFGVRSLGSIGDVILEALAKGPPTRW